MTLPVERIANEIPSIPSAWLKERRWFSSKGRTLESLSVVDWGALPLDEPAIFAIARAKYTTGRDEQYLLPLVAVTEEQPEGVRTPPAAEIDHEGKRWYLHDAFQFQGFQRLLMLKLLAATELPLTKGSLRFEPELKLREEPPPLQQSKLISSEQSNSSVIYDGLAILKCFRRVVPGVNPDVEVSRFLTTKAGFKSTPPMLGAIVYRAPDGVDCSVGLLQAFVPNQGDAWQNALARLKDFFAAARRVHTTPDTDLEAETRELASVQLAELRLLGQITAEMHLAFAGGASDPDFAPKPLTAELIAAWQQTIRRECAHILDDLAQRTDSLPPPQRELVEELLSRRRAIEAKVDDLQQLAQANVVTTRFHGDYHLGQVLVYGEGFQVLDFEGEPLRSLEERRAHSSPLRDVAGMLRSFSYAAFAGLLEAEHGPKRGKKKAARLGEWAGAWEDCARSAFLEGYLATAGSAPFLPKQADVMKAGLSVFELEKALYELNYELNNRPDWLAIPLSGIQRTIER